MLAACRILVAEADVAAGQEVSKLIGAAEAEVLGPVRSVAEVKQFLKTGQPLDAVLLDMSLSDGLATPVLEVLGARHIPTVVFAEDRVPEHLRQNPDLHPVAEPATAVDLVSELRQVMEEVARRQSRIPCRWR